MKTRLLLGLAAIVACAGCAPRYQIINYYDGQIARLDTKTGEIDVFYQRLHENYTYPLTLAPVHTPGPPTGRLEH